MQRERQANPPATKTNNPELWQRTLEARIRFKKGQRVARRVADKSLDRTKLSAEDQTLLEAFHSGELLGTKLEANQAWGFGQGAETKSIEQLAFLDHQIKAYFKCDKELEEEEKSRRSAQAAAEQEVRSRIEWEEKKRRVVEVAEQQARQRRERAEAEEKKRRVVEPAEQQEAKRRRAPVEMARKRAGDRPDRAARKKEDADDESLSLESL